MHTSPTCLLGSPAPSAAKSSRGGCAKTGTHTLHGFWPRSYETERARPRPGSCGVEAERARDLAGAETASRRDLLSGGIVAEAERMRQDAEAERKRREDEARARAEAERRAREEAEAAAARDRANREQMELLRSQATPAETGMDCAG